MGCGSSSSRSAEALSPAELQRRIASGKPGKPAKNLAHDQEVLALKQRLVAEADFARLIREQEAFVKRVQGYAEKRRARDRENEAAALEPNTEQVRKRLSCARSRLPAAATRGPPPPWDNSQ